VTEDELLRRHPTIWHMAADGSWPSIRQNGLLSVTRLLDLYGVAGPARFAIESARRPQSVTLTANELPPAVVRDNKPMSDAGLVKCLQDGLVPKDWYEVLNRKSFFWVDRERLDRLLAARAYASHPQTVLEIDTKALLDSHRSKVRLCRINSGQTMWVPSDRGNATFKTISDFPDGPGRIGTKVRPAIVELVVEGGVPDVAKFVLGVERVYQGKATSLPL